MGRAYQEMSLILFGAGRFEGNEYRLSERSKRRPWDGSTLIMLIDTLLFGFEIWQGIVSLTVHAAHGFVRPVEVSSSVNISGEGHTQNMSEVDVGLV